MDIQKETYTYTGSGGQKRHVPVERVYSFSQLDKGDHITIKRLNGLYWHHAIVEDFETENDTINVIEYSNSTKGFSQDNSSPPKNPGMARVRRGKYSGSKDGLYLIKHDTCLPADDVVERAQSKLGENEYDPFSNNCEHFALWCKTEISSSEQVENIKKTVRKTTKDIVKTALPLVVKVATQTVAKEVVSETVSKGGQEIMKASAQTVAKQVVSQTVSEGGQEIMKASAQTVAEKVISETVSNGGQQILTSGTRETTKEFFSHTAKKAGKEIVTKGTRETTREVLTQTSKTTGNSAGGGGGAL